MYGHLPPITQTIQVRWTRYAGYCWEKISTSSEAKFSYGLLHKDAPEWVNLQRHQVYAETGCALEHLKGAMNDRDRERGGEGESQPKDTVLSTWDVDDDDDDDDGLAIYKYGLY